VIEMIRRFLRQKFDNPIVAVTLAAMALLIAFPAALSGGLSPTSGLLALIVLGAGSVSRDISSGALQMILARPITRTDYLWGRYLGILSAFAIFLAATAVLTVGISFLVPAMLHGARPTPDWVALARGFGAAFLNAVLISAIFVFFSTFLPGWGDVLGYFLLMLFVSLGASLGDALQKPWLTRAGEVARENVLPEPKFQELLAGQRGLSATTGRWALAVAVFLVAAALIFQRREFAYGHD